MFARHRISRSRFTSCKRAFAIPVTYLILFASLIALISLTYTLAMTKINASAKLLRASVAKQNMQVLDDAIHSVAWSFGASDVVYMDDCGGTFRTATNAKMLTLNLTDGQSINDIVFDSVIGEAYYQFEHFGSSDYGPYVRGDDRPIVNKTYFTMTQLYLTSGNKTQDIVLCYRPLVVVAAIGTSEGKPLNLIRVSILSLNTSQMLVLSEKFYLRVVSADVTVMSSQYRFNSSISSLALKATLDGVTGTVSLPITSIAEGAVVNVELVVSNVKLQKTEA